MKIEVYTDGACSKNGKSGAKASWAFYFPDHKDSLMQEEFLKQIFKLINEQN
jgi:ribonuclease HI